MKDLRLKEVVDRIDELKRELTHDFWTRHQYYSLLGAKNLVEMTLKLYRDLKAYGLTTEVVWKLIDKFDRGLIK